MAKPKSASSARGLQAKKKKARTAVREKIDFSDIPEISDAQLKTMRRVGRPPIGDEARQLIAIRIDPAVLKSLQDEAEKDGVGYQTLINEILAKHTRKSA